MQKKLRPSQVLAYLVDSLGSRITLPKSKVNSFLAEKARDRLVIKEVDGKIVVKVI
jgi:hypothetical protein